MSDNRIDDLSEGGSCITYEAMREKQPWKQGVYMRVRFRSSGPVGYGPTMRVRSRKGGDVLRDHASKACQGGSLSVMSATTSIPRARDEENHFPAR